MISADFGSPSELKDILQIDPQLIQKESDLCHRIRISLSNGTPKEAIVIYAQNRRNPLCILSVVPLVFKACASLSMINNGKALHSESIKGGVQSDVVVGTSIVNMYGKCREVIDARKVFDEMPVKNVVTWNAIIGGYMRNGRTKPALCLFEKMSYRTTVSWIEMIEGYARTGDTKMARCIFDQVPLVLRNVVTWTVMVEGYASNGQMNAAKDIFEAMPQRNFFVYSSMISGYFKNGHVEEGKAIFDRIKVRNLVNWNSLISGYCHNGLCEEALDAFAKMQADGFEPDEVSFACALSACAQLGSLKTGITLHHMIIQRSIKLNQFILNGLVDMYAKCGDLTNARLIFEGMLERNDACWNAMISGFSIHGHCKEALEFFDRMVKSSVNPNEITFLSVLTACAHSGFIREGLETFSKMENYGLSPNIKHYGCLVDLLGRAGRLKDAYRIVIDMPMRPNDMIWMALLGACRVHADMDMANQVLERVRDQVSGDCSHYVLMSNMYAASERWEKAESVRIVMSRKRVSKTVGHSSVILDKNPAAQLL
ncbi:pentatricopeptide repeat-containing protein At3g21470-like [Cynara cardunculus var. scolymus]|uniref:pentatricopeptide repeat-containing protein At3g21470-like n=1 Tax=Cynara cardunculus var. scolymus TaxID=59895 RepID=UPI000D628AD3|nr:pentatricopeptide repeat-containing protein At3g21470-like [Cynara cardunculus var. scolymus]XP_024965013.1 pentatricopeptide repeat-containing protein At3g21470-like [Cynara cardunculus var. scolymus]